MASDRPPHDRIETDAEYRVVHGPWPRWMMHIGLIKLAVSSAAVVGACVLAAWAIAVLLGAFD